jgi:hypothetical protein
MIVKVGRKWALFSKKTGQRLGTHASRADAEAQEIAINISKARRAGHEIPRAPRKRR